MGDVVIEKVDENDKTLGDSNQDKNADSEDADNADSSKEGEEESSDKISISEDDSKSSTANGKETDEKSDLEVIKEENLVLRQTARTQKQEIDRVTVQLVKMNTALEKAGLVEKPSEEEQKAAENLVSSRNMMLDNLMETMEINPKYEDIREVVSQDHFDDMVEAMAAVVAEKEGMPEADAEKRLRDEIWGLTNPYKFMYGQIKKYHPKYAKDAEVKEGDKSIPNTVKSIHDASGDTGITGWTATRIDDMDEKEIGNIPKDIYDKYLKGQLK